MNFLRNTMLRVKSARLDRYIAGADRAKDVQRQNLLERVARNANSQFGRDHGFGEIRSVDDFRRRLPIANYEPHRAYIDRVMRGDIEALFEAGTKIWMFAETSGTTAEPKHIPITDRFYRQYKAGWQAWGTGLYRDHPHLLHRQTLQFTSHWKTSFAPSGTPCGNISGLASETRPFYMGSLFVLPKAVIQILDFSAKHYTALRLSLASDRVGMIITANPSTLIEIAKRIDRDKESLIRDIHDGTLSADVNVPEPIRQQLQPRMRANPRRARELSAMADRAGVLRPQDVWPGLEMLAVWTGGSVGIYLDQLPDYFGDIMLRDHGISASEGRMTFPLENGRASGPLDYASHFYEFIPVDEKDDDDPTTLEAHELEVGSDYYILLTTDAGL
ncbi:MAG: GH3 auxin-responsive promoter family protein, partial [Planctomycetota bacterium]